MFDSPEFQPGRLKGTFQAGTSLQRPCPVDMSCQALFFEVILPVKRCSGVFINSDSNIDINRSFTFPAFDRLAERSGSQALKF